MTRFSQELLSDYAVRKSKLQKAAFRKRLVDKLLAEGYPVTEERHGFSGGTVNVVVGDVSAAKVVFSAHYDTCATMPVPNFIAPTNLGITLLYQLLLVVVIIALCLGIQALVFLLTHNAMLSFWSYLLALLLSLCLLFAGPANRHNANDNTSGVIALLEALFALSPTQLNDAAFVFFDNEELGLIGSSHFRRLHKKDLRDTPLVNFDCVSDGGHFLFAVNRRAAQDDSFRIALEEALPQADEKQTMVLPSSRVFYPSDQFGFRKSVAVAALKHKRGIGYYMDRIHTNRDTQFDEENIRLLKGFIVRLATRLGNASSQPR